MNDLTERQRDVKRLLDQGLGARDIASELGVSRNAVYQQIQRLRKHGILESDFTPTGLPPREANDPPGAALLRRLLDGTEDHDDLNLQLAALAMNELREVRDQLDVWSRRISAYIPR